MELASLLGAINGQNNLLFWAFGCVRLRSPAFFVVRLRLLLRSPALTPCFRALCGAILAHGLPLVPTSEAIAVEGLPLHRLSDRGDPVLSVDDVVLPAGATADDDDAEGVVAEGAHDAVRAGRVEGALHGVVDEEVGDLEGVHGGRDGGAHVALRSFTIAWSWRAWRIPSVRARVQVAA